MKPCSNKRKHIVWLAAGALDAREESAIRGHIEICEGCRSYLEEVSDITAKLNAAEVRSDIQASERFHQRVVNSLRADEKGWRASLAQLRAGLLNWRVALPVIVAAAVVIAGFSLFERRLRVPLP